MLRTENLTCKNALNEYPQSLLSSKVGKWSKVIRMCMLLKTACPHPSPGHAVTYLFSEELSHFPYSWNTWYKGTWGERDGAEQGEIRSWRSSQLSPASSANIGSTHSPRSCNPVWEHSYFRIWWILGVCRLSVSLIQPVHTLHYGHFPPMYLCS